MKLVLGKGQRRNRRRRIAAEQRELEAAREFFTGRVKTVVEFINALAAMWGPFGRVGEREDEREGSR